MQRTKSKLHCELNCAKDRCFAHRLSFCFLCVITLHSKVGGCGLQPEVPMCMLIGTAVTFHPAVVSTRRSRSDCHCDQIMAITMAMAVMMVMMKTMNAKIMKRTIIIMVMILHVSRWS